MSDTRAAKLGLVRVLADEGRRDARIMATALRILPQHALPADVVVPGLLDGRDNVIKLARQWLRRRLRRHPRSR